jgi:hypothetical protein
MDGDLVGFFIANCDQIYLIISGGYFVNLKKCQNIEFPLIKDLRGNLMNNRYMQRPASAFVLGDLTAEEIYCFPDRYFKL